MKKDGSWKDYFEDPARYADAINGFGCNGEQVVKPEDLQEIDTQIRSVKIPQFVNSTVGRKNNRTLKFRDMARKVAFGVNYVIVGFEGQETVDYSLPLRNMIYDVAEYEKQARKIRKKVRKNPQELQSGEYLYGFKVDSKLIPVVTFVLYSGENEWTGPTCLHDMIDFADIPKSMQKYVANYAINVISIKDIEDTSMFKTDLRYVLDFLRFSDDKKKLKQLVETTPYYQSMEEDAYDVVVNYANVKGLIKAKEYCVDDGGRMNMCTAIKEMMEDSRNEERMLIAEKMLQKNMSVEDIVVCTGLTKEQIQELAKELQK